MFEVDEKVLVNARLLKKDGDYWLMRLNSAMGHETEILIHKGELSKADTADKKVCPNCRSSGWIASTATCCVRCDGKGMVPAAPAVVPAPPRIIS